MIPETTSSHARRPYHVPPRGGYVRAALGVVGHIPGRETVELSSGDGCRATLLVPERADGTRLYVAGAGLVVDRPGVRPVTEPLDVDDAIREWSAEDLLDRLVGLHIGTGAPELLLRGLLALYRADHPPSDAAA